MKIKCAGCGCSIGELKQVFYPVGSRLEDKVDSDFVAYTNYGGESTYSLGEFCVDCLPLALAKDEEEEFLFSLGR